MLQDFVSKKKDVTRFSTFSLNLRSLPGPNYSLLLLTQRNKPYEDSYLL